MSMEMFTSNDLQTLAITFADYCKVARKDIFEPDTVIVQSMGMQRWLTMQISRHCGICANMRFLFPNNFFGEVINTLFEPPAGVRDSASREATGWRLMQELPQLKGLPSFTFVNSYLNDDALGLKLYQLAHKLADLYDQYALFRPLWVKSWPDATPEQLQNFAAYTFRDNPQQQQAYVWQALLWQRCLQTPAREYQWPYLTDKLAGVLADPLKAARLPKEAFVFGVSYLPPLYVDLLHMLARRMDIYLFLLNPCAKYWGEAVTKYQERAIKRDFADKYADLTPAEINTMAHLTGGNRLLANWGGLGKQLLQKLWEMDLPAQESFALPGYDSMLHTLQSDILTLCDRGRPYGEPDNEEDGLFTETAAPLPFEAADRSLQIHVCHTPLREIEILHDNLLDMFAHDPELRPEDVVVIAPDINTYEPYISAIFHSRVQNNSRINFSVSDRLPLREGLTAAFFMLLDINKTRFEADKVLSLLEIEPLRRSFGIEAHDLAQIEQWLREAQIRWGLDSEHKGATVNIKDFGRKADYVENTWRYGLERLLLTCAMPGFMQLEAFDGILSTHELDFDKKPLLGRLLNFVEALRRYHDEFQELHTPEQWQTLLLTFLNVFFNDENWFYEKEQLQKALQAMVAFSDSGGFSGTLHLEAVCKYLQTRLENADYERGFLSQGVTFCSAKPMRSIPFKVVCFLGMDLEHFPAKEHTASFDLIAKNRRRGDRSKRLDDRYLFLEALISVRDVFYISYTGHNLSDNSVIPPSVMVSELLETTDNTFTPLEDLPASGYILTRHKMHGFDRTYFDGADAKYFSYNLENFLIAKGDAALRTSFINSVNALSPDEELAFAEVSPYDFSAFFLNPAKTYIKKRLNVNLDTANNEILNKEPFDLNGLTGYAARREILDMMLENYTPERIMRRVKQSGQLPHGNLAPKVFSAVYGELKPFADRLRNFRQNEIKDARPFTENIDIWIGDLHIKGPLPVLCVPTGDHKAPVKLCFISYSRDKAEHKLTAWLYHVLAAAAGLSNATVFMDRVQTLEFAAIAEPETLLAGLAALYLKGLEHPLAFFPQTGLEYARRLFLKDEKAETTCLKNWRDSNFGGAGGSGKPGECSDSYVMLCFAEEHGDEIPPDFYALADKICTPFFRHAVKTDGEGA